MCDGMVFSINGRVGKLPVAVITKWLDLGEGRSIWDQKRYLRLEAVGTYERVRALHAAPFVETESGSIVRAFEGEEFSSEKSFWAAERVAELSRRLDRPWILARIY